MDHTRPNPDELIERFGLTKEKSKRGKLKIFFGYCPGVGKTYAMLMAAQEKLKEGINVVAGVVETHGRIETEKLLDGLTSIAPLALSHRGIELSEFNIDAAKTRNPQILLVDELAHTNAPSMRHPKRWQDVEELLNAGINIYTTLNVQHIESLSDVVAGTTGVWVKETVPDTVFDGADDVVLVDINIDELLTRLHEGKVYIAPEARQRALDNFFRERNLVALREIALRRTAEKVDMHMHSLGIYDGEILPVSEKIMVCIGADPLSAQLVRTAKRMAASLKAPWVAVYIENMLHYRLDRQAKHAAQQVAHMVERIGGKSAVIQGDHVVDEIIAYAKEHRVTKIIVGKPIKSFWQTFLYGSLADKLIRKSGTIDIYVVTGDTSVPRPYVGKSELTKFKPELYFWSFAAVTCLTAIGWGLGDFLTSIDQALIYIMGVVFVAAKFGRGPSLLYSFLSVTCFNFFFVLPIYSLNVYDRSYWLTFAVMLMTGFVITNQATRLRLQTMFARKRERNTQTFYQLAKDLASGQGREDISKTAIQHIADLFNVIVTIWLPDEMGQLQPLFGEQPKHASIKEISVIQWCFENSQIAGHHTATMPSAAALYVPISASIGSLGVMGIAPFSPDYNFSVEEIASLETCASLLGFSLERTQIAEMAERSKLDAEREKLRTMLLSSVSHDLRTPLASITGASSAILTDIDQLPRETIRDLSQSINKEAERLSHIVTNLLEVTRLESGTVELNRQPYFIEELIGSALERLEKLLSKHIIVTQSEDNLPLVFADGVLIEQVLINLLENAARYTPEGSKITVSAIRKNEDVLICIADNGPGILAGNEKRIFDKFYSVGNDKASKGTGLGLAICNSVVKAHRGNIWAVNDPKGGAQFYFTIPVAKALSTEERKVNHG